MIPFIYILDDQRLTTFLRGCKFSLEKVKQKLDMYYSKDLNFIATFIHKLPFKKINNRSRLFSRCVQGLDLAETTIAPHFLRKCDFIILP